MSITGKSGMKRRGRGISSTQRDGGGRNKRKKNFCNLGKEGTP